MVQKSIRKLVLAFVILAGMVGLVTSFSWYSNERYLLLSKELHRTNLLMQNLESVQVHANDFVAAYRGYTVDGGLAFSLHFQSALDSLDQSIQRLDRMREYFKTVDLDFTDLMERSRELMSFGKQVNDLYRLNDSTALTQLIATGKGVKLKSEISQIATELEGLGRLWLRQLESKQLQVAQQAVWVNYLSVLISLIALWLLFRMLQRELNRRREAEQQLREMNEALDQQVKIKSDQLAHVFERITDSFIALDNAWHYTYANQNAARMMNRKPEEIIGRHIRDLNPAYETQPEFITYKKAMESQQYHFFEAHESGTKNWFEHHLYPSPEGLTVVYRDMTQRKQAEIALAENRNFIESIIHASPDIIYIYDIELGRNVFVNEGMQKILGYDAGEIKEMGEQVLKHLMHPDDFQSYLQFIYPKYERLPDKEIILHEFRMKDKQGKWHWLKTTESVFLRNPDGTARQIFGFCQDITQEKNTTDAIRASEMVHRTTLERISDAFVSLDTDWRYTYMNAKAGKIFNRNPAQMIGKHIWTEFPEGIGQPFYKAYNQAMATQKYIYLEEYYEPYDLWFENHIYPSQEGLSIFFRDITEKKKAELELKLAHQRLLYHLNHSPLALVEWNSEFRITRWSSTAEKMFGWHESEVLGKRFDEFDFVEDADSTLVNKVVSELIHGSVTNNKIVNRNKTKPGVVLHCEWYNSVVRDDKGKAVSILSRVNDISDRVRAEQNLMKEKQLSDSIINSLPGIFYLYNEQGKFLRWNKNFETVSGYSGDEIARMHPLDFFDDDEKLLLKEKIQGVFTAGMEDVEAHFFTKDKRRIPYFFNGWTASFEEQLCLIGVGIDITERIKAQSALLKSEKRFRALVENSADIIVMLDKNFQPVYRSPAAERITGFTMQERLQPAPGNKPEPEGWSTIKEALTKAIAHPHKPIWAEHRIQNKAGRFLWFEGSYTNLLNDPDINAIVLNMKEITDRKKSEEELNKSLQQLKELTAYLQRVREEEGKRIAREIHDELGQQLTGLKMDATWIGRQLNTNYPAVLNKVESMIKLIDQTIMSVRRISSELRPAMLDDLGLIAALQWKCHDFQERSGIKATFTSNAHEYPFDKEMATELFRIFQEALTNVARHSAATEVKSNLTLANEKVYVSISDNGKGMDREGAKRTKSFGIIGMRERAAMLQGVLEINSDKNGTEVMVIIPVTTIKSIV